MEGTCLQRISFAVFVCYLGGRAAPGDQGDDMHNDVTAEEALRAEDSRYAAQMGGDFAALESLYGDELVYFHSSGVVDTKVSFLELLRTGTTKFHRMTRHENTVRVYGSVAIITGRGIFDVTARGQDIRLEQLFHAVWVKRPAGLQLVSWQATRLLPKA